MKQTISILIGLIFSMSGFSQSDIKVQILPSKIATRTDMIIPYGDKYLYESYSYFKSIYWLNIQDTLAISNDSILKSNKVYINLKLYSKSYPFCDSTINLIRNSALTHRLVSMIDDSCRKYIGWDNKEIKGYLSQNAIERATENNTCSDKFPQIANRYFIDSNLKIKEIYKFKEIRPDWVKHNPDSIDIGIIELFLQDFNYNLPDKETFIEIAIANPRDLINACEKLEEPYQIIWRIKDLPNTDRLIKAVSILKNENFKSSIYRKILRNMKKIATTT